MRPSLPILATVALALASSRAEALQLGLEAGGAATLAQASFNDGPHPSVTVGVLAVQRLIDDPRIGVDAWGDLQIPTLTFETGGAPTDSIFTSTYLPLSLGVRLVWELGAAEPFVGALGQLAILTFPGQSSTAEPVLGGAGVDTGVDLVLARWRLGLELRAIDVLTPPSSGGAESGATQVEALLSLRFVLL
jgi:hypothetical protein